MIDDNESAKPVLTRKCALYVKQSNIRLTAEEQERCCLELSTSKGWDVSKERIYRDLSVSNISLKNRTELKAVLVDAQRSPRPFDYVVIEDIYRLPSRPAELQKIIAALRKCAVGIYFVGPDLDSESPNFASFMDFIYGMRRF
jgi:DNA invertase Pin-like site-specific DNA recombinase